MSKVIRISKLRIGQRFSWIPAAWFGPAKLTEKTRRVERDFDGERIVTRVLFDIIFDAAVVNPPGREYGVPATTRVRLLKPPNWRRHDIQ